MIKRAKKEDLKNIEEFIGNNYYKCLYLYLDLKKYGISNNIKIWIQQNEKKEVLTVILKYYSGMHIYSEKIYYNINEIIEIIKKEKPTMICGTKQVIYHIHQHIKDTKYKEEYGYVRKLEDLKVEKSNEVESAKKEDFLEIARLLYEDEDIGSSYKLNELANQMLERYNEKYTRDYIIRINGKPVAHAGTGAETNNIAVMSYVVTNKEYRKKGLATKVCATLCYDLALEGKEIYLINYSNESTKLYDKLGFEICQEWGKLFINLKEEK